MASFGPINCKKYVFFYDDDDIMMMCQSTKTTKIEVLEDMI